MQVLLTTTTICFNMINVIVFFIYGVLDYHYHNSLNSTINNNSDLFKFLQYNVKCHNATFYYSYAITYTICIDP